MDTEVSIQFEPYDSEIPKIEKVLAALSSSVGKARDVDAFRREAIQCFEEIGVRADVLIWRTNEPGTYIPEIVLKERLEKFDFDAEKMAWEVQHDVLGLGEGGTVSSTKDGLIVVKDPKKTF